MENIPVIPVFLAELEFDDETKQPKFVPFDRDVPFPNSPHARNPKALDELR